jgi:hypothetical protein
MNPNCGRRLSPVYNYAYRMYTPGRWRHVVATRIRVSALRSSKCVSPDHERNDTPTARSIGWLVIIGFVVGINFWVQGVDENLRRGLIEDYLAPARHDCRSVDPEQALSIGAGLEAKPVSHVAIRSRTWPPTHSVLLLLVLDEHSLAVADPMLDGVNRSVGHDPARPFVEGNRIDVLDPCM